MKIDADKIHDILTQSSSTQPGSTKPAQNNDADASLQVDYNSFIDKATQSPPTDTDAVQRAQELLLSGQLDTSENAREAAENIAKFGI
ncbi:MAG: hypothetical protein JSV99_09645 [Planctomycetota bacterium]|nr:MAG: hypothetical protein JSV99_09645 [Planctomycetota bacterium]